jgi:hypothetical protein
MDNKPEIDNLERAQLTVINRKHQFVMRLGELGRTAGEITKILALIDYEKEIEWAVMCYDHCDKMAQMQAELQAAQQSASGS